jgi:YD repeat-containing protein
MKSVLFIAAILLAAEPAVAQTGLTEAVVVTYTYDENGRLSSASMGDDVAFTYDYDAGGNPVLLATSANLAPSAFLRIQPQDSSEVVTDSIRFAWSPSLDPEGETVSYELRLEVSGLDTTISTSDTTLVVDVSGRGLAATALEVRWSVESSDGRYLTAAQNGEGFFILDRSSHVAIEAGSELPRAFALHPNYPNPFNPTTTLRFDLPVPASVELSVFDVLGRRIAVLISSEMAPGTYTATWNGRLSSGGQAPTGVYFYTLQAAGHRMTRKMVLTR